MRIAIPTSTAVSRRNRRGDGPDRTGPGRTGPGEAGSVTRLNGECASP